MRNLEKKRGGGGKREAALLLPGFFPFYFRVRRQRFFNSSRTLPCRSLEQAIEIKLGFTNQY